MSGQEAQEAATSPTVGKKAINSESAEKPSEAQHAEEQQQEKNQQIDGETTREETTTPSAEEDVAAAAAQAAADAHYNDNGVGPNDGNGRPKLPRPTGIQPCPRCGSIETKFCYYNNYNIKQPRYYCKGCQRYWTAGGTLRDVPVGAGRRRTKGTRSQDDTLSGGGFSAGSLPAYVDPALAAITVAAAAAVAKPNNLIPPVIPRVMPPMIPTVIPGIIPPGIIPPLPFPGPVDFAHLAAAAAGRGGGAGGDSFTKATANALVTDPLTSAFGFVHPVAAMTNATVNQNTKISEDSEDGAVEGRRTKRRTTDATDGEKGEEKEQAPDGLANHNNTNNVASNQDGGGGGGSGAAPASSGPISATAGGAIPMHVPPYSMDWFAAQQHPQVAVAMQAQFQAAAAAGYGAPGPYAMPAAMWPGYGYGAFPPAGWPNPAAYAAATAYSAYENGGRGSASGGGAVKQEQVPPLAAAVQGHAMAGLGWPAAQWPAMMMPPYAMPPGVAMPGNGLIPPVSTPAAAGAVPAAAPEAAAPAPSVNNITSKTNNTSEDAN